MRKEKLLISVFVTLLLLLNQSTFGSVDTRLAFVSNTYNTPSAGQGILVLDVEAISNSGSSVDINAFQDAFQLDASLQAQYVSIEFSNELFPSPAYSVTEDYIASTGKVSYIYTYFSGSRGTIGTSYTQIVRISITYNMAASATTFTWYSGGPNYYVTNPTDVDITGSEGAIPSSLTNVALPIQMASFSASVVRDNDVEVAWKTVSETNNYGFEVYRKRNENGVWKKLGFIEGHGTTLAAQSYTYLDSSLGFGKYFYQIKQIDLDGKSKTFPEMNVIVGVAPDQFLLAQNYPNPFNPTTTIEFALPKETHVKLEVYNVIGQRVATLLDETKPMGLYVVPFDASALASGTYFYRLSTSAGSLIKKMMILK